MNSVTSTLALCKAGANKPARASRLGLGLGLG